MSFNGNTNDLSGNNNKGIDYTSQNYVSGKKLQGLDFNGTTDYIRLTNTIDSQNGLTFSFWVKTRGANGTENNGSIISKYSKINNTRSFMIYSFGANETRGDNRLCAVFYKYGTSSGVHDHVKSYMEPVELNVFPDPALWIIPNPKRLLTGTWTHCVINVTKTTIETWLNSELCTKKIREFTTYNDSGSEPVFIGNNYDIGDGANNHFNGILDELRIYNRELTKSEIRALYMQ